MNNPIQSSGVRPESSIGVVSEEPLKNKMGMIRFHLERINKIIEGTEDSDLEIVNESIQLVLDSSGIKDVEAVCESDALSPESSRRAIEIVSTSLANDLVLVKQRTEELHLHRENFSMAQREKLSTEAQIVQLTEEGQKQQLRNDEANQKLRTATLELSEAKKELSERELRLKKKARSIGKWLRTLMKSQKKDSSGEAVESLDSSAE
jgi:hypothetical protein